MNINLSNWFYVIKNCSVDNTYKMGWGKSIVECCFEDESSELIQFDDISKKMFKYYWNQTIFFDLQQGSNPSKPPVFISYVKSKIKDYQLKYGYQPIEFERVEKKIDLDIKFLNGLLAENVSHRFLKISGKEYLLYDLDNKNKTIKVFNPSILKEYSDVLFEVINYRWVQILETYNSSPRISKKIKITDRGGVKRKPLGKFKKYLSLIEDKCFVCGEDLKDDISIDHMIPFSFMFSDDLWNLVYAHKSCNSSKSNKIVSESEIKKLELRNKQLLEILENNEINDKNYSELKLSIENNLLRKFWISFKG
jgi:5-methylcytosine-specific restriction endonuclease McrA